MVQTFQTEFNGKVTAEIKGEMNAELDEYNFINI